MAFSIADRVKETTATTGTGTYTLAGAVDGFESFASIGDGNTTYYVCTDGTDFEVGIGTYTATGTTLARTTILQSTNADTAVNWGAGDKDVFVSLPAQKAVVEDDAGDTNISNLVVTGCYDLRVNSVTPSYAGCVIAIGSGTLSCPALIGHAGTVAIGHGALFCGVYYGSPVAIGFNAGCGLYSGRGVYIGTQAASGGTSAGDVAIGEKAGCISGACTIAIGTCAGCCTCGCSIAIGYLAGTCGGLRAVAIGTEAAKHGGFLTNTVSIGYHASWCKPLYNNCGSVFIGAYSGCAHQGSENVGIGQSTFRYSANCFSIYNVAVGYESQFKSGGCGHVTMGTCAGRCMGCYVGCHTYIGFQAGASCQYQNGNNIAIGYRSGTCTCALGYYGLKDLTCNISNHITMGNCNHSCALIKVGWTTVSDCRDKSCVCDIPHGLDFVRALSPKEYRFKTKGRYKDDVEDKKRYGFLAQDVLTLEGDNPVIINDENPDLLVYEESHMVPVLVNAIKELADKVQTLEELVNA